MAGEIQGRLRTSYMDVYGRTVTVMTLMFLVFPVASAIMYDFEQDLGYWVTANEEFLRVQASSKMYLPGRPRVDATLGTKDGHYVYAEFDPKQTGNTRVLFSACQAPSGPRCRLNFSAIVHTPEAVLIGTWFQCDDCKVGSETVRSQTSINSTGLDTQWTHFSSLLGEHPLGFEIFISAVVPYLDSYVALDNLEILDCERDPVPPVECPPERSFGCAGSPDCLSPDQLCDLHSDCIFCEEDERETLCQMIPSKGYLKLQDCNFDAGECFWYNVPNEDAGEESKHVRWRVVNSTIQQMSNLQLSPTSWYQGSYVQVAMDPQIRSAVATLRSVSFEPRFSGDGLCRARFWYRNTAKTAVLKLQLVEVGRPGNPKPVRELWESFNPGQDRTNSSAGNFGQEDENADQWTRAVVDLNSLPVNLSYILQFKAYTAGTEGEIAVHSVSLSRDCFYTPLEVSSCGVYYGAEGPTQGDCDVVYGHDGLVNVEETGHFKGVQSWTVPETMTYNIKALGSRGGAGAHNDMLVKDARGASVTAKFKLDKGDELHFVVGQMGEDACGDPHSPYILFIPPYCNPHHRGGDGVRGGGGGGGGATIIFKTSQGNKPQVLLVAGGGGGLPYKSPFLPKLFLELGGETSTVPYETTVLAESVYMMSEREVEALLTSPLEGLPPCSATAHETVSWGHGGFGGAGGGCRGGGFGGGADLALVPENSSAEEVGLPGRSFVHSSALYWSIEHGIHSREGAVEIFTLGNCPCDYECLWLDSKFTKPTCLCTSGKVASNGGLTCAVAVTQEEDDSTHIFIGVLLGSFFVFIISIACVCLYIQRHTLRMRHPTSVKKTASFLCPCLHLSHRPLSLSAHVLPQIQRPPAVMHINPNYDIVTTKCPEQGLKELPRKHLKLMSELGQGAFGEVYYGLLSNVPMVDGDLPVAVKTLPLVCTEQTEMDFLMEAVIVSKFNHPNIVKFIGVCFEQHPHYLVLELLEGGDLKSFLRQARPKWDQPSSLTVLDLLRLSLDVARGCQHLEEKHFIHRDIAARNCLLTTKGPNRTAKIADFGMARDIYRSDYYKKAGKAMLPVKWMPPEAFLDGVFTSKTDVWSFGILMWEVFSLGHMPYPGCSNEEVMNLVTQGGRLDPPEGCPSAMYDIMVSCWSGIPEGRPNFSLIIASLERTLQDDDMVSRGLPVFYVPPIVNTRGLKLHSPQAPAVPKVKNNTTKGATHNTSVAMSPNTSGDGYLEPLLTHSSKGVLDNGSYRYSPDNSNASNNVNVSHHSAREAMDSIVSSNPDKRKLGNRNAVSRTPRVFYKPGSNHVRSLNDSAASEALLNSSNSMKDCHSSQTDAEKGTSDLKYELCVNLQDKDSVVDKESNNCDDVHNDDDDLKMGTAATLPERGQKKKSYTHFPRPST